MANLNVTGNFSTSSNTLNVRYTTDAQNITKMEITKDNTNFITADSFTNSSAVFNVSTWDNGTYTCKLRMTHTEATPDPTPDPTPSTNLLEGKTLINAYVHVDTGEVVSFEAAITTGAVQDYIPVTAGATYTFNCNMNGATMGHFRYGWYDSNKGYMSYNTIENTNPPFNITIPNGASYIRFHIVTDNDHTYSSVTNLSLSNTASTPPSTVKIALYKISNMTVDKGKTFNILYSSNISAVKHEFSWDGGSTFWDKTSEIVVSNTTNYKYTHEAKTDVSSYNMAIRVTDRNGNTDTKYFTITFRNNSTGGPENPPAESGNLLDSNGAYVIDDFSGSSVDRSKWDYELGYVRNSELQNYTSTNTEVSNSILALKGIKDSNGNWTSASIISKGHFAFMYGKIECRAKIDPTWGSFSAFWTLGDSFEFGYHDGAAPDTLGEWWAYCGEFDVMEFYSGRLTCGTFFNEREESGRVWYSDYDFNAWHTFAMEWLENGTLIFSIDGHELSRTSPTDNRAFHIPHFILINQAIGASGGTPADSTTAITQYVDWVKYYPASTNNVVLNSSNFSLQVTDTNDSAHNCMVRPTFNDNCINKSLTWSSSDSSLVWVHSGLCGTYAGANGTVNITATSHSGVSQTIQLNVVDGKIR